MYSLSTLTGDPEYRKAKGVPKSYVKKKPTNNTCTVVDNDVAMAIGERVDGVWQQVTLVVDARQTDFAHDARGDSVVSQTKRSKPARRPRPTTKYV